MCGIAGILEEDCALLVQNMLQCLFHRGPDELTVQDLGPISIGATRLAIIDVSGGSQPVHDESEQIHLVFNGEIYNFQQLREDLLIRGHKLRSKSDSEVLVHLYEDLGIDFIQKLRGMFAIAIWDSRNDSLILIRDRIGKKPLLYSLTSSGKLLFASEARALLKAGVSNQPDFSSLVDTLQFGYINAPKTGFAQIASVPPASYLVHRNKAITITQYWNPIFSPKSAQDDEATLYGAIEIIEEAVKIRLTSERSLGSFLSGGIDSTITTALMAKHLSNRLKTFSIGFKDAKYDESLIARKIATQLGTDHHELILDPNPKEILEMLGRSVDQPFADSSILPSLLLSQFASEHVTVALGGDGGDEVFGGYNRYRAAPLLQSINPFLKALEPGLKIVKYIGKRVTHRNLKRLLSELSVRKDLQERYSSIMTLGSTLEISRLAPQIFHSGKEIRDSNSLPWNQLLESKLDRMTDCDFRSYLPGDLLFKADTATMAHSLELRSPFLDHKVIEFASLLPDDQKIRHGKQKYLLRRIAEGLVDPQLLNRPKMGFAIPRAEWLRNRLTDEVQDLLLSERTHGRGWFATGELRNVVDKHNSGDDQDRIIWPMMMTELWARNWID